MSSGTGCVSEKLFCLAFDRSRIETYLLLILEPRLPTPPSVPGCPHGLGLRPRFPSDDVCGRLDRRSVLWALAVFGLLREPGLFAFNRRGVASRTDAGAVGRRKHHTLLALPHAAVVHGRTNRWRGLPSRSCASRSHVPADVPYLLVGSRSDRGLPVWWDSRSVKLAPATSAVCCGGMAASWSC
jgi:hypothetical protein